ncbi:MAG: hypothetical protein ACK5LT_09165 [Lachnospirales bacterium]
MTRDENNNLTAITLQAENHAFPLLVYVGEMLNDVRIIGKAVVFQSAVR